MLRTVCHPWDGKIRRTKFIRKKGKTRAVDRCIAVTQDSGAGYPGPHQCSLRSIARVVGSNGDENLCLIHIRQRNNVRLRPKMK